VNKNQQVFK